MNDTDRRPIAGEFWLLKRDDVVEIALVVETTLPEYMVVWPLTDIEDAGGIVWPSIRTGIEPKWALTYVTTLLSRENCHVLRRHHRDTVALKWQTDPDGRNPRFGGTGPSSPEKKKSIENMAYLGEP